MFNLVIEERSLMSWCGKIQLADRTYEMPFFNLPVDLLNVHLSRIPPSLSPYPCFSRVYISCSAASLPLFF